MATVDIDLKEFRTFFEKLKQAAREELKDELTAVLQAAGTEFLTVVEDEIISRKVMDTRLLLASFHEGGADNVWELSDGGLTLEVGTNVYYAAYVNDGHWKNPQGVAQRFVPGTWSGNRFTYDPSAKTGMVLKQGWVEGKHYFDAAVRVFEKLFPDLAEKKVQEWINRYF